MSDTYLIIYILAVTFVTGTCFGSFINCIAGRYSERLLASENRGSEASILAGRSHCDACGHRLGVADLVPVASYLFLKGRCRYCGAKVSPRNLVSEVTLGAAFSLVALKACGALFGTNVLLLGGDMVFGVTSVQVVMTTLQAVVLVCILTGISIIDLDTYEIPNGLILAGIGLWLLGPIMEGLCPGIFGGFYGSGPAYATMVDSLVRGLVGGAAIGGGMLVLSMIFDKVTGKESLGGGDIKLFFMVSLYLGPLEGLFNLIISCIIGIIFAFGMKQRRIPFGPSIAAATVISLLWGQGVISWYVSLL